MKQIQAIPKGQPVLSGGRYLYPGGTTYLNIAQNPPSGMMPSSRQMQYPQGYQQYWRNLNYQLPKTQSQLKAQRLKLRLIQAAVMQRADEIIARHNLIIPYTYKQLEDDMNIQQLEAISETLPNFIHKQDYIEDNIVEAELRELYFKIYNELTNEELIELVDALDFTNTVDYVPVEVLKQNEFTAGNLLKLIRNGGFTSKVKDFVVRNIVLALYALESTRRGEPVKLVEFEPEDSNEDYDPTDYFMRAPRKIRKGKKSVKGKKNAKKSVKGKKSLKK
jgi:hypothetical protein